MPFSTRVFESSVIRSGRATPASSPAAACPATQTPTSSHSAVPPILIVLLRDEDARGAQRRRCYHGRAVRKGSVPDAPCAAAAAWGPDRSAAKAVDKPGGVGEDPSTSTGEGSSLRRHRRAQSKG